MEPQTRVMLQRMEMQVPGSVRDLKLDNPEVEWFITYTNGHVDVDGVMTTVLDILQKYGVIINDNLVHFGGRQTIHEAQRGEEDIIKIVLIPRAADAPDLSPRYRDPRRDRFRARVSPPPPKKPTCPVCDSEEVEVCAVLGHVYPVKRSVVAPEGEWEEL